MDMQAVFNVVLGICLALAGWIARTLWEAVKELRQDLARLREEIPQKYVSKDDFREAVREIKDLLIGIDNKLDRKQDK